MRAAVASRMSLIVTLAVAAFAVPAMSPTASADPPAPNAPCTILGTAGPDLLDGTPGSDVICGFGGDDTLNGLGGDDTIRGGPGIDTIDSGDGNDYVYGGTDDDTISGGANADVLQGDGGADTVSGDAGNDDVRGGDGSDNLAGGDDDDIIRSRDGGTVDDILCGTGTDAAYVDAVDTSDADCEKRRVLDVVDPTAVDDSYTVAEDAAATTLAVRANDTDPDGGTKNIASATDPTNGTVVVGLGQKKLTYQPDPDYCNDPPGTTTDDFTYTLTPGGSTATVSITVTCVADPAVANDDTATILEDDPATPIDVLANDDLGDTGPLSVTAVTQPADGDVQITGGGTGLTYDSDPDVCNDPPGTTTDDFTYTLGPDGDTGDVHVTISCVNDGPVADDESFTSTAAAVGNTVLVVNDPTDAAPTEAGPHKEVTGDILDGDVDVDGPGPLAVTAETVSSADGGSAVIEADGDFVYTPAAGTSCTDHSDSFDYTVNDGNGGSDVGTVTIETAGCVWYVNNSAAGNAGTSNAPFDTLAQAETASAADDSIYVYDGDNTTTGYAAGITLKAGQRLLGEIADLQIGSDLLATGTPGNRPTLTASGADVVALDDGNTLRGLEIDPSGAGGGVAGGAGDSGGGTIADVRIIDTGTAGTQPGLELDATTGTFNVSDLTVSTSGATGIRLNNAGTVAFADTGTISVTTAGAKALDLTGTNLGTSVFDSVTVTSSGVGGISATNTTGTLAFGDLSLTTTSGPTGAFVLSNAAGVTVSASGTANVSATGGPAVDVTSGLTAALSFDDVDSTNSATDGVNLDGLTTGTFSASSGTISGAVGIGFDLNGGSGTIAYAGAINNGSGATADVTGRTGGTVTFSGAVADSNDAGGGISLSGNTGGSTTFSNASKVLDTGAANAVSMTSSDGHTLSFSGGGLDITTTTGRGFNADASGTVTVAGAGNSIDSTGGGRALSVVNTDIGAADLTFQSLSATGGGSNGIVLDATGSSGNLVVTGNGGTCTIADTSGCSGGTISGFTGADDSGTLPVGTGIVLRNTTAPSFTRVHINGGGGSENYGIRGTSVAGFTMADSVLDGSLGTSDLTANKDGGLRFEELTGTVNVTNTAVSGGYFTNIMVDNTSGSLNATFDNVDSLALDATGGDDAVQLEGIGTSDMNVVYQNSQVTTASGDLFQYIGDGTGGGDLDLLNNTFTNNEPSIVTGGGGLAVVGGAKGPVTLAINNNTMRDSLTNALTVIKSADVLAGTNNLVATIDNNDIGLAGTANSGSIEGDGMEITTFGDGNATFTVTNNDIRQYNSSGIQFVSGSGVAGTGQMNLHINGNAIGNPGTNPSITLLQGIRVDSGVIAGDTFNTCVAFGPNSITGSSDAANKDFRLFAFHSPIRQPGYGGGNTDVTAFANYAAALIGGGAQGTTFSNSASDATATFGGGAACP